jgi:hypothetical protein
MTGPSPRQEEIARRQRRVALIIVGTLVLWLPFQALGAYAGVPVRWMALADLVALAALAWALIAMVGIWRLRREEE